MLTLKGDFLCNILESIREEFTKNNLACVVLAPKEGGREGGREGGKGEPTRRGTCRPGQPPAPGLWLQPALGFMHRHLLLLRRDTAQHVNGQKTRRHFLQRLCREGAEDGARALSSPSTSA